MIYQVFHKFAQLRSLLSITLVAALSLTAQSVRAESEWGARVEAQVVQSELDQDDGDDIDSSGFGLRGDVDFTLSPSKKTSIAASTTARVFDYTDDGRDTREIYGASLAVTQKLSRHVELRLTARRIENIAVLEADSADQTSAEARLQLQRGNNRVRVAAEYRTREYDMIGNPDGDGYRITVQYNRRIGPYHWVRLDARHEDMHSDESPRRSYNRQVFQLSYSHPVAKRLRLIPSLQYRQWEYDSRIAQGDPEGDLRHDDYVAPGLSIAYGSATRGFYADASAEYRIRDSNDIRYDKNAVRAGLRVGFRF